MEMMTQEQLRKELLKRFLQVESVCTDSRKIQPGALFIALKGENFNGNSYAAEALEKGCRYAVVDETEYFVENDNRYLRVDDALKALQNLATDYKNSLDTQIIAITGSNGKTTTKELSAAVLTKKYEVTATPGNFNNHIGLPLTILGAPRNTEILLLEMGDNKPGDIDELCRIAEPEYGIITNIGKDHIEGFGTFEGNIKSKDELFQYLSETGGSVLFNAHIEYVPLLASKVENKIPYGEGEAIALTLLNNNPFTSYSQPGETHVYQTKLIGKYNFENLLTAYALGVTFGVNPDEIHNALTSYEPRNNRSQWIQSEAGNDIILDAYNANPSSVEPALVNFRDFETSKKKLVLLGDMLELGETSAVEHENIVNLLRTFNFDEVILTGEEFSKTAGDFLCFSTTGETADYLKTNEMRDRAVLIKGSRSLKLETLTGYL